MQKRDNHLQYYTTMHISTTSRDSGGIRGGTGLRSGSAKPKQHRITRGEGLVKVSQLFVLPVNNTTAQSGVVPKLMPDTINTANSRRSPT